jgi:hypothetical protein
VTAEMQADLVFAIANTVFALFLVFGNEHIFQRFGVASQRDVDGEVR